MSKSTVLGIDAGSVAIGVVEVTAAKKIVRSDYRFHRGDIQATLAEILDDFSLDKVGAVTTTSSSPESLVSQHRCDNQVAFATAAKQFYPDLKGMLIVGGEKFSFSHFDQDGHYLGSTANTSCAAGTGSFLDQQAGRLQMEGVAELCATASRSSGDCPQIASRCAVFAKTDLIHAQQEGHQLAEISDGLCRGLAKNLVDTLFAGDVEEGTLLFCGGVSKNQVVQHHVEQLAGLTLTVDEMGHLYGAVGACFDFLETVAAEGGAELTPLALGGIEDLFIAKKRTKKFYYEPLELTLSDYPDFTSLEQYDFLDQVDVGVEVDLYQPVESGGAVEVYLGIDIGSTSTKAVLMDRGQQVVAGFYTRTAGRPLMAVQSIFRAIDDIAQRKEVVFTVKGCGTTGSGRKFIGQIIGADAILDEITAHARAACQLNPEVDTIIEIGGQDAKFTTLKNGRVTLSTMNNVCAAGTGSFIEEQAAKLGCPIRDYSGRTEGVRAPMASDRCTVFMERDINHHLIEGYSVDEVLASALHSVRENYLLKVATEKAIGETIFFQGATAKNKALVAAFEQRLGKPILVSAFCHLTGALGTALTLYDERREQPSHFVGIDLYQQQVPLSSEVCQLCNNHCKISVAEVRGTKVAYGFLCGRDYEGTRFVKKGGLGFELLPERRKVSRFTEEPCRPNEITIGLPAAVHMVDDLVLWKKFFTTLGISTVTSENYKEGLKRGKHLSRAEFCAPISAMHGHTAYLLEQADFVFLPFYLEKKAKDVRRQNCYYTQFLPSLVSMVGDEASERIVRPVIRYLYTSFHTKMELYRMLKKIAVQPKSFLEVSHAYDSALDYDNECRVKFRQLYKEKTKAADDVQVVFVGRPYTILVPSMNAGIPHIFNTLGIDTFYQDMVESPGKTTSEVEPLLRELHWDHAAKIIEVSEVIAKSDNIYPVYVTSFKCSPDSFGVDYFKSIMEANNKPYLVLELDEHDSSVGYETRIEAAVRSFRNHRNATAVPMQISYVDINPQLDTTLDREKKIVIPNWDHLTCSLLVATLQNEGYDAHLMQETDHTIRESLKTNSGQCIPLNAIAQGLIHTIEEQGFDPAATQLWLNRSTLACNIPLYAHHIKTILMDKGQGFEKTGVYVGELSFADISLKAAMNAYFAYVLGGMIRKVGCKIRPYEVNRGETDRVINKSIKILSAAFRGKRSKEEALSEVISHFEWIETQVTDRPKVAVFGDLYVRDNRVMNQDLVRFIEAHGGEVITTPYSEYAKMIASSYFKKWFKEGHYLSLLSYKALLVTMTQLERSYCKIVNRILDEPEHEYSDSPEDILAAYAISSENTGESMDNILKIHYVKKYYPDVSLFVQASPALCCASLITEAMKGAIEEKTGVPVVSITYDGTGGNKNSAIVPYLKFPRRHPSSVPREVGLCTELSG